MQNTASSAAGSTSTGDILQISATISGIAVALAAIMDGRGPVVGDEWHPIPTILLMAGFAALFGSFFAMLAIWTDEQIQILDLLDYQRSTNERHAALYLTMIGLCLLGAVYFASFILLLA